MPRKGKLDDAARFVRKVQKGETFCSKTWNEIMSYDPGQLFKQTVTSDLKDSGLWISRDVSSGRNRVRRFCAGGDCIHFPADSESPRPRGRPRTFSCLPDEEKKRHRSLQRDNSRLRAQLQNVSAEMQGFRVRKDTWCPQRCCSAPDWKSFARPSGSCKNDLATMGIKRGAPLR